MASRTVLSDDLDGIESDDVSTVTIRLDDDTVELDLSDEHYAELQRALSAYFDRGRPQSTGRRSAADYQTSHIRQWATANGYDVAPRGRVAKVVQDAYHAEQERRRSEREAALAAAVDEVEDEAADEEPDEVDENQSELHLTQ